MQFEYDPKKSESNAEKHGIDFEEAQQLWADPYRMTASAKDKREKRKFIVAQYAGARWMAIYTERGDAVRIISARRTTKKEAALYDRHRNQR